MEKCNYRFKKEFANNRVILSRERVIVTKDNLTDALAQKVMAMPGFRHNIELIPGQEAEVLEKKKAEQGVLELPESIVSALSEAPEDEQPSTPPPPAKESKSTPSSKPSTVRTGPKKRGSK